MLPFLLSTSTLDPLTPLVSLENSLLFPTPNMGSNSQFKVKSNTRIGTTCFGGLQSVGSGNQNIYGDVFFNAYYGVFDASGPQFGFAPTV
jgi:hypothetical protein